MWMNRGRSFLLRLKTGLYRHYTAPQVSIFKTLRSGFALFFSGLVSIYIANSAIEPSIKQELLSLFGLILCAIGFIVAMLAYIRLVISRIVTFFSRK